MFCHGGGGGARPARNNLTIREVRFWVQIISLDFAGGTKTRNFVSICEQWEKACESYVKIVGGKTAVNLFGIVKDVIFVCLIFRHIIVRVRCKISGPQQCSRTVVKKLNCIYDSSLVTNLHIR